MSLVLSCSRKCLSHAHELSCNCQTVTIHHFFGPRALETGTSLSTIFAFSSYQSLCSQEIFAKASNAGASHLREVRELRVTVIVTKIETFKSFSETSGENGSSFSSKHSPVSRPPRPTTGDSLPPQPMSIKHQPISTPNDPTKRQLRKLPGSKAIAARAKPDFFVSSPGRTFILMKQNLAVETQDVLTASGPLPNTAGGLRILPPPNYSLPSPNRTQRAPSAKAEKTSANCLPARAQ